MVRELTKAQQSVAAQQTPTVAPLRGLPFALAAERRRWASKNEGSRISLSGRDR